jgi:hypothetical protein
MTPWWLRADQIEPPGPEVVFRLSLVQARDVFEAYKASRFARPFTTEIVGLMRAAIADAVTWPTE